MNPKYFYLLFVILYVSYKTNGESNNVWRVAGLQIASYMRLGKTNTEITGGMQYRTFKTLQNKLNFSYRIVNPITKFFGMKAENGSWIGMVGQLINEEADIAFVPIFVMHDRFDIIDYTTHVMFHRVKFVAKSPETLSNWSSIIKPFPFHIWIIIFGNVIIFGIILYKVIVQDFYFEGIASTWSLSKVYWFLFGSFTFQAPDMNSMNRFSSRLLITVWWFSILILVSCYTGLLMSFMTYPLTENVPSTFHELALAVQNEQYSCIYLPGSDLPRFIMGSKTGSGKILGDYTRKNLKLIEEKEILNSVLSQRVVFLNTVYMIKEMIKQFGHGEFIISEDSIVTFTVAYALRKGFPYRKQINNIITRLFEAGLSDRDEVLLNLVKKPHSDIRPLAVEDILSPLALLFIGYSLSLVCFLIEMGLPKFRISFNKNIFSSFNPISTTG